MIAKYNDEMIEDFDEEMCFTDKDHFVSVIERIKKKSVDINAQDIRLIFWFDH